MSTSKTIFKKSLIVYKPKFFLNNLFNTSNSVLPYFLIANKNFSLIKSSKKIIQLFWKLKQLQNNKNKLQLIKNFKINVLGELLNSKYLLNSRNNFFDNKINLTGSRCWMWFFDIYKNIDTKIDKHIQNEMLIKNMKLIKRRVKKKFGKVLVEKKKIQLSFLFRKNFIKRKRRNIRKLVKIIKSLSIKNSLQILKAVCTFNWINSYKKIYPWKIRLKRQVLKNKRRKYTNPYLFLNNKLVNLKKPKKYTYEHLFFKSTKKSSRIHNKIIKAKFFSKKLKKNGNKLTPKSKFFTKIKKKLIFKKLPAPTFKKKLLNLTLSSAALPVAKLPKFRTRKMKKKNVKHIKRQIKLNKILFFKKKNFVNILPFFKKKTYLKYKTVYKFKVIKIFKNFLKKKLFFKFKKTVRKKKLYVKKIKITSKLRHIKKTVRKTICKRKIKYKYVTRNNFDYLSHYKIKKFPYLNKRVLKSPALWNYYNLTSLNFSLNKNIKSSLWITVKRRINNFLYIGKINFEKSFSLYKSTILKSRTGKSFIFRNSGIFLWSQKKIFLKKGLRLKYMFKKKIYSFLFPNEVRRAIMNRRKSFKSYRFIQKTTSNFKKKKPYYSLTFFKNTHKFFFKLEALNKSLHSTTNLLKYKPMVNLMTREEVLYEDGFYNKGHIENLRSKEIFLKRIRFKPGYQRIWRQAREAALEHFKIRTVYQQQLTKYLSKFYRQAHFNSFMYMETTLGRTIVYSRLLPDYATASLFKEKNFVFLNGQSLPDLNTQVIPSDFIQLIISNWFYIYNRWITNTTLLRMRKFKRLVYRKGMANKYKIIKLRKQKSRYTPKWIYYSRFDHSDIKTYFEVDYFTISMFVLYNPYILDYSAPDDTIDLRISIYKMYNWKYIT